MRNIEMRLISIPIIILTATIVIADAFPIQSQNRQTKSRNTKQKKTVTATKTNQNPHFEYLKVLHEEKPVGGKLLGRLGLSSKGLSPYKIKEYNSYLISNFPKASSDRVQMFLIESYKDEKMWDEAQVGLLKFVYLYPSSSIYKKVLDDGYTVLQDEKYFGSYRDKLLLLLTDAPKTGKMHNRYYDFLDAVHDLKNKKLRSIFERESWEYLRLYPDRSSGSMVLMWLAQLEQENNAFHPAVMIYEKLMALYPSSKDYASALYQVAMLKQEKFNDYNDATVSFRRFLKKFPKHNYVAHAQHRIATMADKNFNDWSTAVKEYEKLAKKHPTFKYAVPSLLRVGEIQATKLKLKDQAISTYNRVASEYPDSTLQATEALQRSAKLYQKAKEYEEAIHQYMAVNDNYPKTNGALKSLKECATIYEKKMKQKDKAIEILNTIIKEFPESKDAKRAEKRIKKLNK